MEINPKEIKYLFKIIFIAALPLAVLHSGSYIFNNSMGEFTGIAIAIGVFLFSLVGFSESLKNFDRKEPEFVGNAAFHEFTYLTPLEKRIFQSGKNIEVKPSSFRISVNRVHKFVIKVKDVSQDPQNIIKVFELTKPNNFLPFKAKRHGTSSYLIDLGELPIGEYAITSSNSKETFNFFGIDRKPKRK